MKTVVLPAPSPGAPRANVAPHIGAPGGREALPRDGVSSNGTPSVPPPAPAEDEVRRRAYLKWEAAGRPWGDGVNFWLEAEQELRRAAREVAEALPKAAPEKAHGTASGGSDLAGAAGGQAGEGAHDADAVGGTVGGLWQATDVAAINTAGCGERLVALVRRYPVPALLVALCAGVLLTRLLRR